MDLAIDLIYELVMYGKSLSAGPCEVLSIDLAIKNLEVTLPPMLFVTFSTCRCWSTTTKKGRVYENATRCTKYMRKYKTDGRYPTPYPDQSLL